MLEELLKARGAVVSSEELLERVWDANTDPFTTTVRVTVMTLRKKLGDPPLIETVVGAGYRMPNRAMTVYDAAPPGAGCGPTLRLRLTLLNGVLLVGAGAILVLLAWLLVRDALRPTDELLPGTTVVLADGRDARRRRSGSGSWSTPAVRRAAGQGRWSRCSAISVVGVAGAYVVAGRALRPLHQVTATAQRLGEATLDQRIGYSRRRRRGGRAGQDVRRDAGPDRRRVRGAETVRRQRLARAADPAGGHAHRDRRDAQRRRRRRRRVPPDGRRWCATPRSGPTAWSTRCWCWPAARRRPAGGWSARYRRDLATGTANALSAMRREAERIGLDVHDRRSSRRRWSATRACSTGWPAT